MTILGLSFGYHDSTVSIIKDSQILYAGAEQQYSRQKHDSSFPHSAISHALAETGLQIKDIDRIVYHENPYMKFSRVLTSAFSGFPHSRKEFVNAMKVWLGKRLWVFNDISQNTGVAPSKIAYLNHHTSHAAQAFVTSGFDSAGCLIIDAVGDWSCTSLYKCFWESGKPRIEKIEDVQFPNSLGLLYSSFTAYLGFQPNNDECSVMALAGFGNPVYLPEIEAISCGESLETIDLDTDFLNFTSFYKMPYTDQFIEVFGKPRDPSEPFLFSCFDKDQPVSEEQQKYADIAASIQAFFEKHSLIYLKRLKQKTGFDNLCLAGGGALNCVNNTHLKNSGIFNSIYIPPDPGDGGTSFGAALYFEALQSSSFTRSEMNKAYLGGHCLSKTESLEDILSAMETDRFSRYAKHGFENKVSVDWTHKTFDDQEELSEYVAKALVASKIIGWVQGRNELGPRALGNRSILIRPDKKDLALRLSREVKDRALYRPYALSMTETAASEILDIPASDTKNHRWMQFSAPIKSQALQQVISGVHVDGTTRPQVCSQKDNPNLHRLLQKYGKASGGAEALINTSFNESGYPIVQNSIDALVVFARTSMDCLVIGNTVIEKGQRN